jgi:replicative DNA helicase
MTAEQWILGSILLGYINIKDVTCVFNADINEFVYFSMKQLAADGAPIDLITLAEQIHKNGWLDRVGASYLAELADGVYWEGKE